MCVFKLFNYYCNILLSLVEVAPQITRKQIHLRYSCHNFRHWKLRHPQNYDIPRAITLELDYDVPRSNEDVE